MNYNCYNIALEVLKNAHKYNLSEDDKKEIELLISQYYYGIAAKKELYYKLVDLGIIKEEE